MHPQLDWSDTYGLGRIVVSIEGCDEVATRVRHELGQGLPRSAAPPDLVFRFEAPEGPMTDEIVERPIAFGPTSWFATYGRLRYRVTDENGRTVVRVGAGKLALPHRSPVDKLSRWGERSHLDTPALLAKDFLYVVFDSITQLIQVSAHQSWVHAAAATNGERTVLITGSGGSGKTSSVLGLVARSGWRYLADDLALVDDRGVVHRSPKHLQVYAYNLVGDPDIARRLRSDMNREQRIAFMLRSRVLGRSQARHRISADALFGVPRVAPSGAITDVVHLRRANIAKPFAVLRESRWLAERSSAVLTEELQPLTTQLWKAHAADGGPPVPHPVALHARTTDILARAFEGARGWSLDVPNDAAPSDVATELTRLLRSV